MSDQIEARVSGTFVHAGDGRAYGDGETCTVSEETLERHPRVLERVDGEADEADKPDAREEAVEEAFGESPDPAVESDGGDLTTLDGVGEATADALREAGFETADDVRGADADELAEVGRISEDHAAELTSE